MNRPTKSWYLDVGSNGGSKAVMNSVSDASDTYSEAETAARREAALKRMLATPHKPHQPIRKKPAESQSK